MNKVEIENGLVYDELTTLSIIDRDEILTDVFNSFINIPFNVLYILQREGKLTDETKSVLNDMFEKTIINNNAHNGNYRRLYNELNKDKNSSKHSPITPKIPRRYGKSKLLKDIDEQGGKKTTVQNTLLHLNQLKNTYLKLERKLIRTMVNNDGFVSDDECREINTAIITLNNKLKNTINKK